MKIGEGWDKFSICREEIISYTAASKNLYDYDLSKAKVFNIIQNSRLGLQFSLIDLASLMEQVLSYQAI